MGDVVSIQEDIDFLCRYNDGGAMMIGESCLD